MAVPPRPLPSRAVYRTHLTPGGFFGIIGAMQICGLNFTTNVIHQIHQTLDEAPSISRRALSRAVCTSMGWTASSGRLKETVCRKALAVLDAKGFIKLPAADLRSGVAIKPVKPEPVPVTSPPVIACELVDLGRIEIEQVGSRYSKRFRIWKELVGRHHYLGSGPLCGAQLRYLISSPLHGYLGALSFGSAAFALKERDKFITWTDAARRRNLARVLCNSRFLILPHVQVKNFASHVLGLCASRIAKDWQSRYGVEPVLLETFVDPTRFKGTSYRAANWISVGQTSGRRGAQRVEGGGAKEILVLPLRDHWRRLLCEEPQTGLCLKSRAIAPADWVEEELSTAEFYDPRLNRRLFSVARDFYNQPQALIPQACGPSGAKGAYRFFDNKRVTMDNILGAHAESTVERIKSHAVVLAVQDTSTLNYTAHPSTEGLGPISTTKDPSVGLILHDTMTFTTQGTPLGLLDVQCWARDPDNQGKSKQRKELPIEQKESVKWLKSYRAVCEAQKLCPDTMLVSMGDREADIYELFLEADKNPQGPKLLVRCDKGRSRKTETGFLWDVMPQEPVAGFQAVSIPGKGGRPPREAKLEVRHAKVTLQAPKGSGHPPVEAWVIYTNEIDYPASVDTPLEWMLLTTVEVGTFEQACERIAWYAKRWCIEIYHRTLKSGCKIEDRRLDAAESLKACLAVDMVVAWRVYHLTKLGREVPDSPCTICYEEHEWKALYIFSHKSPVLPKKEPTMREFNRMVGSLGGFLGRKRDGEPGPTAMWRGIQRLHDIGDTYRALAPYLRAGP